MSLKDREAKASVGSAERSIQDLFSMKGRTILITGGGGAMGLEIARSILETGGDVICVDRATEPLPVEWSRVQAVAKQNSTCAWYKTADVTNHEAMSKIFEDRGDTRFPLQGLVTCHGISAGGASIDFSLDTVGRLLDVNFTGTYACAQAAAREFCKQGVSGSIVLVASMSAHGSNKGVDTSAYNSSKAAVVQLARSLAAEWGARKEYPLIRVNTISPGYIRTRQTAETLQDPEMDRQWCQDNMLMRLSNADEYRGAAMFLLSDASSFVTGTDLRVDGGHTAW